MFGVDESKPRRNVKERLINMAKVYCISLIAFLISACSLSFQENDSDTNFTINEQRTISIFGSASKSVVHITSMSLLRDRWSLSVYEREEGTGTGFLWDDEGHIVTNYHVVREGQRTQVTLAHEPNDIGNGEHELVYEAQVIGVAPDRDLAVLKLLSPPSGLKALPLGSSKSLSVGQFALAIGNPFGFDQTLTTGVISGLGREIKSVTKRVIKGVIQTDAAINPGNSGGPLLDSSGRVIGVNTAIFSPSGAYAGIGFAVPIDTVKRVVPQLIKYGGEIRPSLGVELDEGRIASRYRLPGALILRVEEGSPASAVKLRGVLWRRRRLLWGDVIIAIDGQRTKDAEDVYDILDDRQVGQEITLTVQRGLGSRAKRRDVRVKLSAVVESRP